MDSVEEFGIVIVGGGISGLATALALHRKGIESVVLERAECLRSTGAAIGILTNGWRVLDELGVGSELRQTALPIQGIGEARCLKRNDLVTTLVDNLPLGTIRLGCHDVSVQLDQLTSYPILQLHNGSTIRAKILIGCDGANSVIAGFLELKPPKIFSLWAVRGFTNYPNGHGFGTEFTRLRGEHVFMGRIPVNDKLVYWFVAQQGYPHDSKISKDLELRRQLTLKSIEDFPAHVTEMIENSDLASLSLTHLTYRAPWDILLKKFRNGTVTVAGDTMHIIGRFLGQGGAAGMEDAIVLARCLAQIMEEVESQGNRRDVEKIGEALDEYVSERRKRLVVLSTNISHWFATPNIIFSSEIYMYFLIENTL